MSSAAGEILGLRFGPDPVSCALQPLVERLLAMVRTRANDADSASELPKLRRQLEELSATLLARRTRETALELTEPIALLCERLLDSVARVSTMKELAAAVALVREAVSSSAGSEAQLNDELLGTANRFEALRQLNDLPALKAGLAHEVTTIKELAAKREHEWQTQMSTVEARMKTLEERLTETRLEAAHDALTGLVNRSTVESAFEQFAAVRRRFVLALFDVDDFKTVNDTLGHLAGDSVLKSVARSLESCVRSDDVVGRFGGDEFILIMLDVSLGQAEFRLRTLLQRVRSTPVGEGSDLKITVTCGASEYTSSDSFESLLERADQALYQMKRTGKDRLGIKTAPPRGA